MARGQKKKNDEPQKQPENPPEEDLSEADMDQADIDEWMAKYIGENKMTHTGKAVKEMLPELEQQLTQKINKRYEDTNKEIEDLRSKNKRLHRSIEKLQYELQKREDKISELVVTIDSIAQKEFINDVQVVGLTESPSPEEDMKKVVKMAKEKVGMKLKKTDVKSIHRLGKMSPHKSMPRDLVIRFKEQTTREEFQSNRKKMATSKLSQQNIYVNDRLTTQRKGLFFEARKLYKARQRPCPSKGK